MGGGLILGSKGEKEEEVKERKIGAKGSRVRVKSGGGRGGE